MRSNKFIGYLFALMFLFSMVSFDVSATVWDTFQNMIGVPFSAIDKVANGVPGGSEIFYSRFIIFLAVFSLVYVAMNVFAAKANWDEKKSKGSIIAISISIGAMGAFAMPQELLKSLFNLYGNMIYIGGVLGIMGVLGYAYFKLKGEDGHRPPAITLGFLIIVYLLLSILIKQFTTFTIFGDAKDDIFGLLGLLNFAVLLGILWNIVMSFKGIFAGSNEAKSAGGFLKEGAIKAKDKLIDWNKGRKKNNNVRKDLTQAKKDYAASVQEIEKLKAELDKLKAKPVKTEGEEKKVEKLAEELNKKAEVAEEIGKALAAEGEKPPEAAVKEVKAAEADAEKTIKDKDKLSADEKALQNRLVRFFRLYEQLGSQPASYKLKSAKNEADVKKYVAKYKKMYSLLFDKMYDSHGNIVVSLPDNKKDVYKRLWVYYVQINQYLEWAESNFLKPISGEKNQNEAMKRNMQDQEMEGTVIQMADNLAKLI